MFPSWEGAPGRGLCGPQSRPGVLGWGEEKEILPESKLDEIVGTLNCLSEHNMAANYMTSGINMDCGMKMAPRGNHVNAS